MDAARDALRAWERATSSWCEKMSRDPQTLELGGALLGSLLAWQRASNELAQQMWRLP